MKYLLSLFLMISVPVFGQDMSRIVDVKISSEILKQQREVLIYTPASYDENELESYDVIYVLDAQNREIFDYVHSVLSFINNSESKFIVVGIVSLYDKSADYSRNNDMLPTPVHEETKNKWGKYAGNADNFMLFIKDEIMPYMERNYRVSGSRISIGHSNSASFLIYTMTKLSEMFDAYIAISPNFANDKGELVNRFENTDFELFKGHKFLYLCNANEEKNLGWESWKPQRERIYNFLNSGAAELSKIDFKIEAFPDENHWSTLRSGLSNGLKYLLEFKSKQDEKLSYEFYEVVINVTVPDKNDTVFITGNQIELGGWQPDKIKLKKLSDFERQIKLKVRNPIHFKFTRGNWESEAIVEGLAEGKNIKINIKKNNQLKFKVINWIDK